MRHSERYLPVFAPFWEILSEEVVDEDATHGKWLLPQKNHHQNSHHRNDRVVNPRIVHQRIVEEVFGKQNPNFLLQIVSPKFAYKSV